MPIKFCRLSISARKRFHVQISKIIVLFGPQEIIVHHFVHFADKLGRDKFCMTQKIIY